MKYILIAALTALMHIATFSYAAPLNSCESNSEQTDASENKLLQRLIPNFAKEMQCEVDTSHCMTKWDIRENSAKFSVAWKKQCGPIINGEYQLGDEGHGSTFVCEKQSKGNKTCCFPLGYDYAGKWVDCVDEPKATPAKTKKAIHPAKNLSSAIVAGDYVFLSGTVGIGTQKQPVTGIRAQTTQVMEKLKLTLADVGLTMSDVVKSGIFIRNPTDFEAMNEVYRRYFPADPPARTTVVTNFPGDEVLVEIEMIAYRGK